MEVMWKLFWGVINRRIREAVKYHNVLHGLRIGRGMGTTSIEYKLLHQLAEMKEEVLYEVFLDLRKSYGSIERERHMEILVRLGGPARI